MKGGEIGTDREKTEEKGDNRRSERKRRVERKG